MFHIKFRPLVFSDVIGQNAAKTILSKTIAQGLTPSNAYLLPGPHGVGKTTLARIFARALLCSSPLETGDPCNECPSCKAHIADTHTGYREVDAANHGDKDEIQSLLQSLSYESESGLTVVLLDECQGISKAGKDALLKLLETVSGGTFVFLFCTTEPHKVPLALYSRCTVLPIRTLEPNEVQGKLKAICDAEGLSYEPQALFNIALASAGHMRDAEQLLRTASLVSESGGITEESVEVSGVASLSDISKALVAMPRNPAGSLAVLDRVISYAGPRSVYEGLLYLLTEAARYGLSLERATDVVTPARDIYRAFPRKIQGILDYILTKQRLDDAQLLRADLVVIHARYLLGEIKDIQLESTPSQGTFSALGPSTGTTGAQRDTKLKRFDSPVDAAAAQRAVKAQERSARLGGAGHDHTKEEAMPSFGQERTNVTPRRVER